MRIFPPSAVVRRQTIVKGFLYKAICVSNNLSINTFKLRDDLLIIHCLAGMLSVCDTRSIINKLLRRNQSYYLRCNDNLAVTSDRLNITEVGKKEPGPSKLAFRKEKEHDSFESTERSSDMRGPNEMMLSTSGSEILDRDTKIFFCNRHYRTRKSTPAVHMKSIWGLVRLLHPIIAYQYGSVFSEHILQKNQ